MGVKHFLWFLRFCGMIDWNCAEDKQLFWLVVERNDDPDQSVFKILKKVTGRKPSDPIFKVLRDRLISKSLIELSYEDFCENLIIYVSKKNALNSKSNIFERKFKLALDEQIKDVVEKLR